MKKQAKTVSIILSVTMFVVTVFAIVFFTYSWYQSMYTAQVSHITMATAGVSGIQLSGDGVNWKSVLSTQSNPSDININSEIKIDSISTAGEVVDGQIKFYKAGFVNNVFQTMPVEEKESYYVFDFYIYNSDTTPKMLNLGYTSSVVDLNEKDVAMSARVAFVKLGNVETPEEAIALDGTGVSQIEYIWEPNSTTRNKRIHIYQQTYLQEGKVSYKGVNRAATGLNLVNNLVVDSPLTPEHEVLDVITYDPINSGEKENITLIEASSITKLRVFIWAEGQDIDCVNSISGGFAAMNFSFSTKDVSLNENEEYVVVESFNAPVLQQDSYIGFSWNASNTNLSTETFSNQYLVRIKKQINETTIVPVRSIITSELSINLNQVPAFIGGIYVIEVKAISLTYGDSDYSNTFNFEAFNTPNTVINGNMLSWNSNSYATSYTVKAVSKTTLMEYTFVTSTTSHNLTTTQFSGGTYLVANEEYYISVRVNGTNRYTTSVYSANKTWSYQD